MPTYVVTGKLGSGKTLACVGRIRDALIQGRPVATNLDIDLSKLLGKKAKNVRLYRLPDKPTAEDFYALGNGNDTYEEENNGLLVLDECGTWFNARDWQDKTRRPLIDWLIHARKWGWDPYFILQDVSAMDKQARKSLAEHVVYCRRMDRFSVPLLDGVYKLFFDKPMPKKKIHVGIVKYGDLPHSPTVDRWWYIGHDLYRAYDTKQVFQDDYPHNLHQILPPWYSHGRYQRPRDWRFIMKLTKIHFRKYSRVLLMAIAATGGAAIASVFAQPDEPEQAMPERITPETINDLPGVTLRRKDPEPEPNDSDTTAQRNTSTRLSGTTERTQQDEAITIERWRGGEVTGVATDADGKPIYARVQDRNGAGYSLDTIRAEGFEVSMPSQCEVVITEPDSGREIALHTAYCPELG